MLRQSPHAILMIALAHLLSAIALVNGQEKGSDLASEKLAADIADGLSDLDRQIAAPRNGERVDCHAETCADDLGFRCVLPERDNGKEPITNSIGMRLVLVPPGEFLMGAPDSDNDAEDHEKPQHKVRITKPFYMGIHEVTVGQFRKFVEATRYRTGAETDGKGSSGYNAELRAFEYGKQGYTWRNVGWKQDDDHPVLNLTWDDATAFCRWLSKKENRTYRLPTEAEWEYACRAGTTTRFYSGDALDDTEKVANVLDQSLIEKWEAAARDVRLGKPHKYNVPVKWNDGYPFTAPVGRFKPNPFGLYDMHGNVAEWCADWYDKDCYRDSPGTDPTGPAKGTARVVRGGAFLSSPKVSRASMRVASFPDYHNYVIGFRVVLEQDARDSEK